MFRRYAFGQALVYIAIITVCLATLFQPVQMLTFFRRDFPLMLPALPTIPADQELKEYSEYEYSSGDHLLEIFKTWRLETFIRYPELTAGLVITLLIAAGGFIWSMTAYDRGQNGGSNAA